MTVTRYGDSTPLNPKTESNVEHHDERPVLKVPTIDGSWDSNAISRRVTLSRAIERFVAFAPSINADRVQDVLRKLGRVYATNSGGTPHDGAKAYKAAFERQWRQKHANEAYGDYENGENYAESRRMAIARTIDELIALLHAEATRATWTREKAFYRGLIELLKSVRSSFNAE